VPNDNINYYITYSNLSGHTIRKLLPHEKELFKDGNKNKKNKKNNEMKKIVKVLGNTISFLTYDDYNKLLMLNKFLNAKIKKKIYNYVLKQKNLKKEIRLKIWMNVLNINKIKKEYDYQKILTETNDEKVKYEVKLDVNRTAVGSDNLEFNREKISNILYAVAMSNDGIKYCQGMNFIVCILYEIYGEEEAFYIFLSFFKSTEYPKIFAKDLQKLKIFFYDFNRILQLLEPELSSYLIMRNATVDVFLPLWFITLFTSSHQHLREKQDNINLMVRILDNFILSGWKGMMSIGIALLHNFESTIMSKNYQQMMEFLINDMLKSDFFEIKNIDKLEEYFETIKINKTLIENIELEYMQNAKINETNNQK
jgi:hypothetical protein